MEADNALLLFGWFAGFFALGYVVTKRCSWQQAASQAQLLAEAAVSGEATPASDDQTSPTPVGRRTTGRRPVGSGQAGCCRYTGCCPARAIRGTIAGPLLSSDGRLLRPSRAQCFSRSARCIPSLGTTSLSSPFVPWPSNAASPVADHGDRLWLGKLLLACYVAAVSLPDAWNTAHTRRTNMDRVAAELEKSANPTI